MNSGVTAPIVSAPLFLRGCVAFRGQRSVASRTAETIRLPPSTVRAWRTVVASSTDDTLANTTSDSMMSAVVPAASRVAPYCSA